MKKVLIYLAALAIIGVIVYVIWADVNKQEEKKVVNDYEQIESVVKALSKVSKTKAMNTFGNAAAMYEMDLLVIHNNEGEFYESLEKELGEDFECELSNGDEIYIKVYPMRQKIWVYAGGKSDENMIYPDWNYDKLEKRVIIVD